MSFYRAFAVSVLGTGLSRVMGFVRDVAISRVLGASTSADVFWMAWTVPGLLRRFVADEGLTGALLPAIARAEGEEGREGAQRLANQVLSGLLLLNAGLLALAVAVPELFVWAMASGWADDPAKFALTAQITRWLMPFVAMVSMVSFFEGLLNHRGHFFVPKLAPAIVSAALAASVVLLGSRFQEPAWALVAGVWVGGPLHVLVHLPVVWSRWGPVRLARHLDDPRFRGVAREMAKVIAIGVFAQLNVLVLRSFTSYMAVGAVTRYTQATRLIDLAQGMVAVAVGSALLPTIARSVVAEDWSAFRAELAGGLRLAAFLLLPAAVGLFVYAVPVVSVFYLNERFTWEDVLWTASALQLLTPFLLAVAGVNILKRVYFALDQRDVLLRLGAAGLLLTALFGWLLIDLDIVGLAAALSLATTTQLLLYVVLLRRRLGARLPLGELALPLLKMAAATVPMALFAYWAARHGRWSVGLGGHNLWWFGVGLGGSAALYPLAAWMLGVEEVGRVVAVLRRRVGR